MFTGVFAYYLYETNPRTAPAEQDRLQELIKWKRAKAATAEQDRLREEEEIRALQAMLAEHATK